jgi:hypothetical protein
MCTHYKESTHCGGEVGEGEKIKPKEGAIYKIFLKNPSVPRRVFLTYFI